MPMLNVNAKGNQSKS